jgi:hypothetical protein
LAVLAVIVGIFMNRRQQEKKRSECIQHLARGRGWKFESHAESEPTGLWGKFPLFERGRSHSRQATNLVSGSTGDVDFALFDYFYVIGSGKNRRRLKQSVVFLRSPRFHLAAFELRPESVFHKIGGLFGYQDIDFDASPEFSAKYLLRGEHEGRVRKLFNSSLRRYLESTTGWSIEGLDDGLLIYRHNKRSDPEEVPNLINDAAAIGHHFNRERATDRV